MATDELARRLRHEKQCLLGIPRALGGLVAAEGDELPFSFALEIRPAPDLCLRFVRQMGQSALLKIGGKGDEGQGRGDSLAWNSSAK